MEAALSGSRSWAWSEKIQKSAKIGVYDEGGKGEGKQDSPNGKDDNPQEGKAAALPASSSSRF